MTLSLNRSGSSDLDTKISLSTDAITNNALPLAAVRSTAPLTGLLQSNQTSSASSPLKRLVVIDANVQDYASLAAGVLPDEDVLILDAHRDGLTQISEALAKYYGVASLYLVSHGGAGYVQLGSSIVDFNTLSSRSAELQHWSSALTPNADILLYGCDVAMGEQGVQFVQQLHNLTGADVAASTDVTGSQALGGNWNLETAIGQIESPLAFQAGAIAAYQGTLATTYVSDLTSTATTNGWGPVEKDKSNGESAAGDGKTITLNGVTYTKGLGVHASSELNYNLGGAYTSFTSDIGVDDEVGTGGSVIFQVWADGVKLYDSGLMTGSTATKTVTVDLTGKQALKLIVTDSGNGNTADHADWANAQLVSGSTPPPASTTTYISDLTSTATTNGWGPAEKDKSNGESAAGDGRTLTLNGVTYIKGMGVNASSELNYTLGGNYTRFLSDVGVDDEVGSNGSVIFQVWVDGVKLYDSGLMTGSTATKTADVNLTGKQALKLIVTDGGNGATLDHADWANARLLSSTPANQAPVAVADNFTLTRNTTFTTGNVLTNDSDPDNNVPLTAQLVAAPTQGSLTLNSNGTFTYIPTTNFTGTDRFTYVAKDALGAASTTATVSLTVNAPANQAPVAVADNFTLTRNTTFTTGNVLTNDSDPDNNVPLTAQLVTAPTQGSLTLNSNGTFTYIPTTNFTGTDRFTYVAKDALGAASTTATVSLTVNAPANQPPVAAADNFTLSRNTTFTTGNVLTNDSDPDNNVPLTAQLVAAPTQGSLTLNSNGTFTYIPTTNFTGTDRFTYVAKDALGAASTTATVSLTVNAPANQAPVAVADNFTLTRNTTFTTGNVLTNDSDPDNNVPLTAQLVAAPTQGSLTLNSNGTFTYIPTANYVGTDSFTYLAKDALGAASTTATVSLSITAPANQPPLAVADNFTLTRNTTFTTGNVLTNDSDPDNNVPLTAQLVAAPTQGSLTLNSNGTFTYIPTANYVGTDSFTYVAKDALGAASTTATVSLSITAPANQPPVAVADTFTLSRNTTFTTGNVLTNDSDPDNNVPLTAQLVAAPTQGSLTLNSNGTFTYIPTANYIGTDSFTYVAKDALGAASTTATVSLTVNAPANQAPVAVADTFTLSRNTTFTTGNVLTNDSDPDNNVPLTAQLVAAPTQGSLTLNSNGTFTYIPTANYIGTDSFTYLAKDALGAASTTATVSLSITAPANQSPVAVADAFTLSLNTTFTTGNVLTNDSDPDNNVPLTAQLVAAPTQGSLTLNSNGTFTYIPTANYIGTDSFTYLAKDALGAASTTATVSLSIAAPANQPPVAVADTFTLSQNTTFTTGNVLTNDSDPDNNVPLTAQLVAAPTQGSLTLNSNGTFTYIPIANYIGTDSFTYVAKDALGAASTTATVSLTVNAPANQPPVAVADNFTLTRNTTFTTGNVLTNDSDPDNNVPLTAQLVAAPTQGSLTLNSNGTFTYIPTANYIGTDSFTYLAKDALGAASTTATVSLSIAAPANQPPVAVADAFTLSRNTTFTTGNVLTNDSDPDNNVPLTAQLVAAPTQGSLTLNSNGTFTYIPTTNFTGTDSFTYVAKDALGAASTTATVSLTVNAPANQPPVAVADTFTLSRNTTFTTGNVLTNDSDPDNNVPLTAQLVTAPTQGSLTLNSNGTFTYIPTANYIGTDSFTYVAKDALGAASTTATVSLTVNASADTIAPTATLTAATLSNTSAVPYTFSVNYTDATAVDVSTIDNSDIRITGPNSFTQLAQRVSVNPATNGSPVTATYQITAPDGLWNWNDKGTYTATLLAGSVLDTLGNTTTADATLGTFQIAIQSTLALDSNSFQVTEGGAVTVRVNRVGDTSAAATIQYFTGGNSTATAGSDYVAIPSTTLNFAPGDAFKNITVQTLEDTLIESNETFSVLIDSPTGADLGTSRTAFITIVDNDTPPPPPPPAPVTTTYLSDLTSTATTNGWGTIEKDKSNGEAATGDGNTITLNGVTYTKGLGVHASSELNYTLGGNYTRFLSDIGVDDEVGSGGSVIFQVWADGTKLYDSGLMTGSTATKTADVDLTGKQALKLIVTDSGNGNAADHADWANARILTGSSTTPPPTTNITYVSDLTSTATTNGWGTIEKDKSNGESATGDGNTITLNGVTYTKGIGVHASSELNYTLGGNYTRFLSDVGVDDEVGNGGSVIFQVWADGTKLYDSGLMIGSSATQTADVDLTGKQALKLIVTDGGNGNATDHADWANARLVNVVLPPGIALASSAVQVGEAGGTVGFVVQRTGDTTGTASVAYATVNGTAIAGSDYTAVSGTLAFAAGETQKTVTVPILNDTIPELSETFTLQLSNAVGAALGALTTSTATIADDDIGTFTKDRVVTGLSSPTAIEWSPDGSKMYIAQKNGVVRVVSNGTLLAQPLIDISAQVNEAGDRGLLGIAVNPNFLTGQPYIYLLFTYDPPETNPSNPLNNPNSTLDDPDQLGNRTDRLIRVTADAATNYTTVVPGSEVVLLGKNDLWQYISRPDADSTDDFTILPSGIVNGTTITAPASLIDGNGNIRDYLADDSSSHSVGSVRFGTDGALYVTIGDGTSYNAVDPRAVRVQDVDNLSGKLLRIDPLTGQGLADNPFVTNGNLDSNRSKVWSYGFRNPFRFTIQPTTGTPYIGDVGWNTWEEVNVATKGGNFGWPYYEGAAGVSLQNAGYSSLSQAQAFYASGQPVVPALLARNHNPTLNADGKGATALIMGDFYSGNTFPSIYKGALFYTDVGLGMVYSVFFNADGTVNNVRQFDSVPGIVEMATGPDGNLYYVNLYGGEIDRWRAV